MSQLSDSLRTGLVALTAVAGESVTLGTDTFIATIRWLSPAAIEKEFPQFGEHISSTIHISDDDIDDPPQAGQIITDADDNKHRIVSAQWDGLGWLCVCATSRT